MEINNVSSSNRRQIHLLKECIDNLQESNRTLQRNIENVESLLTEFIKKQNENKQHISYSQGYKSVGQKSFEEDSKLLEKGSKPLKESYKVSVSSGSMFSKSPLFMQSFSKDDLSLCGKDPRSLFEQYEICGSCWRTTSFPLRKRGLRKRFSKH